MCRPWSTVSSPVLTTRRDLGGRDDAHEAAQQAGGTDSSGQGGDHGARLTVRRTAPGSRCARLDRCRPERTSQRAPPGGRRRHAAARHENRGRVASARAPWARSPGRRARRGRLRRHAGAGGDGCRRSCPPASASASGPCRPARCTWRGRTGRVPAVEWFVGPVDVVHGTNFVVPPTRRAARVVTVHDLTTVRYPELCDRSTLGFPRSSGGPSPTGRGCTPRRSSSPTRWWPSSASTPSGCGSCTTACPPASDRRPSTGACDRSLPPGTSRYVLAVGTDRAPQGLPRAGAGLRRLSPTRIPTSPS